MAHSSTLDAFVIGAGFGGMYALHRLRELGLTVHAIEAGKDVGGTWYWNRYPGARCDVMSIDYSYSFCDEIQQEWTWSEQFAAQPEILAYANHVATRLDLRRDIEFDTRAAAVSYDEAANLWCIQTEAGAVFEATYCFMATGPLSHPKGLDIAGAGSFRGDTYHAQRWPHHEVSFAGKRVGVIGTGSSGIQIVPVVAEQAAHLHVFQRTPSFTLPMRNRKLAPEYVAEVKAQYPHLRAISRNSPNGGLRPVSTRALFSVSADERHKLMEDAWNTSGHTMLSIFGDLLMNQDANDVVAEFVRGKVGEIVRDPVVAEALKPRGYPIFARRPCLDTGYYEAFNRDNVTLVDCLTDPIEEITPTGIRTREQHVDLDIIIAANGYDALTGAMLAIDVKGRGGCSLREKWKAGARSYLGLLMDGFPNLFVISGPNGPSALANFITISEHNVNWACDCISHMERHGLATVEATAEAENAWMDHIDEIGSRSLMPKANTWYTGTNVAGKPRNFPIYAGGFGRYADHCRQVVARDYEGLRFQRSSQALSLRERVG